MKYKHNHKESAQWFKKLIQDQHDLCESYLREKIAHDIWMEFDGDNREVWLADVLSRCADIARGKE